MEQRRERSTRKNVLTSYANAYSRYLDGLRTRDAERLRNFQEAMSKVEPIVDQAQTVVTGHTDPVDRARQKVGELVPLEWLEADWELVAERDPEAENLLRLVPRFDTGRPGVFLRVLLDPHLVLERARGKSDPPIYEAVRLRSPQTTGYSEGVVRGPGCTREQVQEAIARALVPYLTRYSK